MPKVAKIVNESELKDKLYSKCSKCGDNQFWLRYKNGLGDDKDLLYNVATYNCCNCTATRTRVYRLKK